MVEYKTSMSNWWFIVFANFSKNKFIEKKWKLRSKDIQMYMMTGLFFKDTVTFQTSSCNYIV